MPTVLNIANVKPLAGYVLVQPAEVEKQTASGIILPDSHDEKPQHGVVLAVGGSIWDDGKEIVPAVKKGDKVIYKKWGGNDFKIGDIEYQFLKFEDILATIS